MNIKVAAFTVSEKSSNTDEYFTGQNYFQFVLLRVFLNRVKKHCIDFADNNNYIVNTAPYILTVVEVVNYLTKK